MLCFACNAAPNNSKEQLIIEYALADLCTEGDATIELVSIEQVPWLDYDCTTYILKVNGKRYEVSVQEKEGYVHYVDVIKQMN